MERGPMVPFPYLPMAVILASLVSFMVIQLSIFAYAGFMVEYLGVVSHRDQAGYYAGSLSSALFAGRMISSHFWGLVTDRYGCRFVMVVALVSTAVFSLAFGVSTTFTWALTCRFLVGLFNGMIAASKTLIPVVCGKEHEAVGLGVVSMAWSLGAVLGPGLGGVLAEPAKHHPLTFSEHGIFGRNPYLLPNMVGAGLALLSLPLMLIFVEEAPHTGHREPTDEEEQSGSPAKKVLVNDNPVKVASCPHRCALEQDPDTIIIKERRLQHTEKTPMIAKPTNEAGKALTALGGYDAVDIKPRSLLEQSNIRTLLFIDGLFSFAFTGFDEVFALWTLSTVDKGGLDWSAVQIGQLYLATGSILVLFEALAVPNLIPRTGVRAYQRVGAIAQVPAYMMTPALSTASASGLPVTALSLVLLFTCYACASSSYLGLAVAINNATGPERRGELNGLSAAVTSFARAFAPVVSSVMFAFSIDGDHHHPFPFDYHLVFCTLAAMSLVVACMGWNMICDT